MTRLHWPGVRRAASPPSSLRRHNLQRGSQTYEGCTFAAPGRCVRAARSAGGATDRVDELPARSPACWLRISRIKWTAIGLTRRAPICNASRPRLGARASDDDPLVSVARCAFSPRESSSRAGAGPAPDDLMPWTRFPPQFIPRGPSSSRRFTARRTSASSTSG